jgi:hypothetical protein
MRVIPRKGDGAHRLAGAARHESPPIRASPRPCPAHRPAVRSASIGSEGSDEARGAPLRSVAAPRTGASATRPASTESDTRRIGGRALRPRGHCRDARAGHKRPLCLRRAEEAAFFG